MIRLWSVITALIVTVSLGFLFVFQSEVKAVVFKTKPAIMEVEFAKSGFQKYVDELPILPVIKVSRLATDADGVVDLNIRLQQIRTKMHRDIPEADAWGYEGSTPGPIIEVESGQALRVHWVNELKEKHILPAATGMDMSGSEPMPDVRNVTHLHGAVVEQSSTTDRLNNSDGWPDAWNVPGQQQIAFYPNQMSSRLLFYHDHAVGTTGRNVAAGLIGLYVIRDPIERSLHLPTGPFEVSLLLQSRGIDSDGSLYYVENLSQEHYGNVVSVNGKLWPFMNVEPRKYRFRIVNGSNARSYDLALIDSKDQSAGPAFYQIGGDGGLFETPVMLNDPSDSDALRLKLAPAERGDIIIDFSKSAGKSFYLSNNNRDADDGSIAVPQLMMIKVSERLSSPDVSKLPNELVSIEKIDPRAASISRQIDLTTANMGNGMLMQLLNGKTWHDPVTERARLGSTEIWKLVNATTDVHPFHVHLVNFQVLDRTPFNQAEYLRSGKFIATGAPEQPDDNEKFWKDTVRIYPGTMTRIIMKFDSYAGSYVYHCHILEHEDMDMMRPFEVYRPASIK